MGNIIQDWILDYLRTKQPKLEEELEEIRQQSKQENIPIIEPEVGQLLNLLVKIQQPTKILELGTAYGYSTLWLAQNFPGKIVTLELKEREAKVARDNFTRFGYNNIDLIVGDALEIMPDLNSEFDFIFIDAAKGQYLRFLEAGLNLITDGGLIVADDVLFKGMIADDRFYHPRFSTLTRVLREYVTEIMEDDSLDSSIIPLGDGVAISRFTATS